MSIWSIYVFHTYFKTTVTGMLVCSSVGYAVRGANLSPPLSGLSSHLSPYLPTAAPCPSHIALVSWPSQSYLNSHRDSLILQRTHNWPLCPHYGHGWPFVKVYFLVSIYLLTCGWALVSAQVTACPGTPRSWRPWARCGPWCEAPGPGPPRLCCHNQSCEPAPEMRQG